MKCQQNQDQIVQLFDGMNDWEDRYKKLIEMGKELNSLPEELKTSEKLVKGCQSQVWLHAFLDAKGNMILQADSDALIVKGLVALLVRVYSGCDPEDILNTPPEFLKKLGLEAGLTPSRANGLHAMLQQIKNFAIAFRYLKNQEK